ncbi:MAG: hypothetical protein ACI8UO_003845 [Verrucomicrobiales bacterium]|jgi:hypothetical protein
MSQQSELIEHLFLAEQAADLEIEPPGPTECRYLTGELSAEEADDFERSLADDPARLDHLQKIRKEVARLTESSELPNLHPYTASLQTSEKPPMTSPFSMSVQHALTIPRPQKSTLMLSQLEPATAKNLIQKEHDKWARLTIEEHFEQLLAEPGDFDSAQACLVLSSRNVMANLRCAGYIRGRTPKPLGVIEEPDEPARDFYVIGQEAGGSKMLAGRVGKTEEDREKFDWFVSGVPVLWDGESRESIFRKIVTESADHSHVWTVYRANHPETTPESSAIWTNLHEIFIESLELDEEAAFQKMVTAAATHGLKRETNMLHHLLGVDEEGNLYQLIGTGLLEDLGRRLGEMGATRGVMIDNSGSTVLRYYPTGIGQTADFKQLYSSPNHRPKGTAYLIVGLSKAGFKMHEPIKPGSAPAPMLPEPIRDPANEKLHPLRDQFLSLFVNATDGRAYRNADALKESRSIGLDEKLELVIESLIEVLKQRKALAAPIVATDGSTGVTWIPVTETARARIVGMLLALRAWFRSSTRPDPLPMKLDTGDGWTLSPELFLVKAALWSQMRWGAEYAFEYRSAKSAREILQGFGSCWFGNKGIPTEWLDAITSAIRFHTLPAQIQEGSANFGPDHEDLELSPAEQALCWNLFALYAELRKNGFQLEKKARFYLGRKNAILPVAKEPMFAKRPSVTTPTELMSIETHVRSAVGSPTGSDLRKTQLVQELRKWALTSQGALGSNAIRHFVFDQIQLSLGLTWSEDDVFQPGDLLIRTQESRTRRELRDGIGEVKEYLIDVAIHPVAAAEHLFDLKIQREEPADDNVIRFLADCFDAMRKNDSLFDGITPLPMVKRLLDLCSSYRHLPGLGSEAAPNKSEMETRTHSPLRGSGKLTQVFRATISFEGPDGSDFVSVWLPDVGSQEEWDNACGPEETGLVLDVITRYLAFVITNQGMSKGYSSVDIDFSDSDYYEAGTPHFYQQLLPGRREQLGAVVFNEYLDRMKTSRAKEDFARARYEAALSPHSLFESHQLTTLNELQDWQELEGRLIVGVDVGGTSIKIQIYRIVRSADRPKKSYLLADVDDTDEKLWLQEVKTRPIPTDRGASGEGVFKNAKDFAAYIHGAFLEALPSEDSKRGIVCVGVCWPGPVGSNRVIMSSGILKKFHNPETGAPFDCRVFGDSPESFAKLGIAEAMQEQFATTSIDCTAFTVLSNDGDSETIGMLFHRFDRSLGTVRKFWRNLLRGTVAVVKAGTGTAGSVLVNGVLVGLMEFGKLIVHLLASNRANELRSRPEDRWPVGDLNKFFSVNFLRSEAELMEIAGASSVTGRDLELLHDALDLGPDPTNWPQDLVELFGVEEITELAAPYVNWSDLVSSAGHRKFTIHNEKEIMFRGGRFMVKDGVDGQLDAKLQEHTIVRLAEREGYGWLLNESSGKKTQTMKQLLIALGKHRLARLDLLPEDRPITADRIEEIGRRMGRRLADLAALLQDACGIDALFIGGGPLRGILGERAMESFVSSAKPYLRDRFHKADSSIASVEEVLQAHPDDPTKGPQKLIFEHVTEPSNAMLGAAILAFNGHVRELKIRELQLLKQHGLDADAAPMVFHSREERDRFLSLNPDVAR